MSAEELTDIPSQQMEAFAKRIAEEVKHETGESSLKKKTPREAVDKYFDIRDLKPNTEGTHRSSLNFFIRWCEEVKSINDMRTLTGDDLADYRIWRRDKASKRVDKLSPTTEESQQTITRTFIEFCESFSAVPSGLHQFVIVPTLDEGENVRSEILDSETAKAVLDYLRKYEYASVEHVVLMLLGASGMRVGDLHSLDKDDYVTDSDGPYLKLRHRPDEGTELKNQSRGERTVYLKESVAEALDDYIADQRVERTDKHGREPLVTTSHGRMAKSTMRNYVYRWTQPCAIGKGCPYDKDPEECKAALRKNDASKCPDSLSCHPVRKGYITQELKAGVPMAILSDRCDVSEPTMQKHYDFRTDQEKMSARKVAMELAHQESTGYGD